MASPRLKIWLSGLFTLAMVAALLSLVDLGELGRVLAQAKPEWLGLFLALLVPQILLAGWRWKRLVEAYTPARLSLRLALCQVLGGYSANLVVPGKLGEMVKGLWVETGSTRHAAFFLVALEKLLDLGATIALMNLALFMVLAAPLYQPRAVLWLVLAGCLGAWFLAGCLLAGSRKLVRLFNRLFIKGDEQLVLAQWNRALARRGTALEMALWSMLLWTVQIFQFWCMFRVFDAPVRLMDVYVGAPLALLAGTLPLTLGGIGLRDAVLLWYFGPALGMARVLSVGALSLVRIVTPAAAGLPCFVLLMRGRGK